MAQIITHRDPWPELEREYFSAVIEQKGSSITYELPDGLRIKYIPEANRAGSLKKAYAFGIVRKEAREFLEAHPGIEHTVKPRKIIAENEKSLSAGVLRGGYYADVKAAYWTTARNLGIISEKTFQRFHADKYLRNAAIGALASKVHIWTWDRETGKKVFVETIIPPTAPAYWLVSSFVAERMSFGLDLYLFFWVDCAYTTSLEAIDFLKHSFPPHYQFTEKRVSFVRWNAKERVAFAKLEGEEQKPYYFERFKFDFFDQ